MSDCVDREAVLDLVFVEYCKNCALTVADEACTIKCEDHRAFMEKIAKLPAVEPERPKGHWIDKTMYEPYKDYICSVCGKEADYFIYGTENWWSGEKPNFCPACGADMREGDAE